MKPPYEITSNILQFVTQISEKIGEINANLLDKPSPKLRKQNRIKTIHNSLKIEGNTLTEEQITAIIENKRVIGPQKDITEVLNTIESSDTVFETKINPNEFDFRNLSEMELAELNLQKQAIKIKSIKGNFYPTLSLNGSLGSGYSENRKYLTPQGELLPTPFGSQISENFYQSASVSLSIPIFNKNSTRSELQINALELKKLELNKEQQELDVINKLEQLKMDVSNAKALYKSALIVLNSAKLNYSNSLFKYENGAINYIQFLELKDKLYQAQSKLIQAKYQMKFKEVVLGIYMTQ